MEPVQDREREVLAHVVDPEHAAPADRDQAPARPDRERVHRATSAPQESVGCVASLPHVPSDGRSMVSLVTPSILQNSLK